MLRFFDYLIFLSLLFLALIVLGKVFSGNLWIIVILCIALVWLGVIIAAKLDHYRDNRRIRRGITAYLKETVVGKK